jgi:hypothetical protein
MSCLPQWWKFNGRETRTGSPATFNDAMHDIAEERTKFEERVRKKHHQKFLGKKLWSAKNAKLPWARHGPKRDGKVDIHYYGNDEKNRGLSDVWELSNSDQHDDRDGGLRDVDYIPSEEAESGSNAAAIATDGELLTLSPSTDDSSEDASFEGSSNSWVRN